MAMRLGSGNLVFEPVEGWEKLPPGWSFMRPVMNVSPSSSTKPRSPVLRNDRSLPGSRAPKTAAVSSALRQYPFATLGLATQISPVLFGLINTRAGWRNG